MRHRLDPDRPTSTEVAPLVVAYYSKRDNACGGSLHIVLDDHNVDDDSVAFCVGYARECGDADGEYLAQVLLHMSRTQREKMARATPGIMERVETDAPIPRLNGGNDD